MNWLIDKVFNRILERALQIAKAIMNKIPLRGRVTFIGVLVGLVGGLVMAFPEYAEVLGPVGEFLKQYQHEIINAGATISSVGFARKALNV